MIVIVVFAGIGLGFLVIEDHSTLPDELTNKSRYCDYTYKEDSKSKDYQEKSQSAPPGHSIIVENFSTFICNEYAKQSYDYARYKLNERDVEAQEWMKFYAACGVGVGVISIALLFFTWRAGVDNITETRRIGQAQTRAYLSFVSTDIRVEESDIADVDIVSFFIELTVRNTGNSPAINIETVLTEVTAIYEGMKYVSLLEKGSGEDLTSAHPDLPHGESKIIIFFPTDFSSKAAQKIHAIICDIKLRGHDVFGKSFSGMISKMFIMEPGKGHIPDREMIAVNTVHPHYEAEDQDA